MKKRGVAVVTGVGRRRSIGAGLAIGLAQDGWDLVLGYWQPYDDRVGLERTPDDPQSIAEECLALGVTVELVPCNLADPDAPELLIRAARALGPVEALVMSHCESVDSSIMDTTVESFDRHYAVNVRATWPLMRAFAEQCRNGSGSLLEHVDSISTAYDFDLVRHLLGDEKLNYLGVSYGTWLGAL